MNKSRSHLAAGKIRAALAPLNLLRGNWWYSKEWVISRLKTIGSKLPERREVLCHVNKVARRSGRLRTRWSDAPCAYIGSPESWELVVKQSLAESNQFRFIDGRLLVEAAKVSDVAFRRVLGDVQVAFVYNFPGWIDVLPKLHENCVVLMLNWDDSFAFYRSPYASLAPVIDCMLSQTPECARKYLSVGIPWLFLPEGGHALSLPERSKIENRVVYVGNQAGKRAALISKIEKQLGDRFKAYGPGSQAGVIDSLRAIEIQRHSSAALALSDLGFGVGLTHLKCRHYEIPCAGALLLAEDTYLLSTQYKIGKECISYGTITECERAITWLLNNEDEAWAIRKAGHARAIADYTWLARFNSILLDLSECK